MVWLWRLVAGPSDGVVAAGGGAGAGFSAVGGGAREFAICATDAEASEVTLGLESHDDAVFFAVDIACIGKDFDFPGFLGGICGDAHTLFDFCGFAACGFGFEVHGHQDITRRTLSICGESSFPKHPAVHTVSCEITDILEVDFDAGLGTLAGGIACHTDDDTSRTFFEAAEIDCDLDGSFSAAETTETCDVTADATDRELGLERGGEIALVSGAAE